MGDLLSSIFGHRTVVTPDSHVGPSVWQLPGVRGGAGKVTFDGFVTCDIHAAGSPPISTAAVLQVRSLGDHLSDTVLEAQNDPRDYLVQCAFVHCALGNVAGLAHEIDKVQFGNRVQAAAAKLSKVGASAATSDLPVLGSVLAARGPGPVSAEAVQYECFMRLKPVRVVVLCNFLPVQLSEESVCRAAEAAQVPPAVVDAWLKKRTAAANPSAEIAGGSRVVEIMVENIWSPEGKGLFAQVDMVDVARAQGEPLTEVSCDDAPAAPGKRGTRQGGSAEKSEPPPKSKHRLYIPIASCALPVMHVQPAATLSGSQLPQTFGVPWSLSNHADSLRSSVSFSFVYLPALAGPSGVGTNPWAASGESASSKPLGSDDAGTAHSTASSVTLQTADLSRLHLWALVLRTAPNSALKLPTVAADPLLSR